MLLPLSTVCGRHDAALDDGEETFFKVKREEQLSIIEGAGTVVATIMLMCAAGAGGVDERSLCRRLQEPTALESGQM